MPFINLHFVMGYCVKWSQFITPAAKGTKSIFCPDQIIHFSQNQCYLCQILSRHVIWRHLSPLSLQPLSPSTNTIWLQIGNLYTNSQYLPGLMSPFSSIRTHFLLQIICLYRGCYSHFSIPRSDFSNEIKKIYWKFELNYKNLKNAFGMELVWLAHEVF